MNKPEIVDSEVQRKAIIETVLWYAERLTRIDRLEALEAYARLMHTYQQRKEAEP
jgi:hypothetical protein